MSGEGVDEHAASKMMFTNRDICDPFTTTIQ